MPNILSNLCLIYQIQKGKKCLIIVATLSNRVDKEKIKFQIFKIRKTFVLVKSEV